jgi:DNA repair exonuclease SbcCD nuclease subunit
MQIKLKGTEVGIFSDPHYGVHRNSEVWHKIALDHAKWAARQFKERGIQDIIIPGDIFHDRNDIAVNTLHIVTDIFDILRDFNIVITVGNHDAYYRDNSSVNSVSILRGWSNITVVDTLQVVDLYGKKIALCPWGQDITQVPECDLIIGHFEINSFKMNSYKVCTTGLKTADLLERAKLTITGHFHHRDERKYDRGTILYAGSPYQQDWGDFGTTKGLYILDITTLQYNFIENNISPQYRRLYYTELINGTYTPETLKAVITGNIVKFIVNESIEPSTLDTIVRKLVAIKPVEFTIEHDLSQQSKLNIEEAANKEFNISIEKSIEEFIDLMDIKDKTHVKKYITELYQKACLI